MGEKKRRFMLSPELVDGDHCTVVDDKEAVLDAVGAWCDEFGGPFGAEGERCSVKIVEMSDKEVNDLPEI